MYICVYIVDLAYTFFMKKNTLLYLDSFLVERAKQEDINISELTEQALKQTLEKTNPKTAAEYLRRAIVNTCKNLSPYGEAHLLPLQIQSLTLKNMGKFQNHTVNFKKDTINAVCGPNGSGKSTIIRAIHQVFCSTKNYFSSSENAEIQVQLFPDQQTVTVNPNEHDLQDLARGYKCLIMDEVIPAVSPIMLKDLIELLSDMQIQVIATAWDNSMFPKTTNIINLQPQL
jgi:ABC-type glutathione transport system ATPase component